MASPEQFAKNMRKRGADIEANTYAEQRRLAGIVSQVVILSTPVDTGRARGNWFVGVGGRVTMADEDSLSKTGDGQIAENQAVIETAKKGETIYISNNLPYIRRLNEGWSAQAPAGFVEKAVGVANAAAKKSRVVK